MAELVIETTEGLRLRQEIAGAGSRAAAGILDLILCGIVLLVLIFAATVIAMNDPSGATGFFVGILAGGVLPLLILYQIAFGILGEGRTVGKRLLGIRVVDAQGAPASPMQHILRGLFWPLDVLLMVPLPLGLVIVALTRLHQRLGDLVAGTTVLRDTQEDAAADPYARDTWSGLEKKVLPLVLAHAERFDGEDLAYLRDLLGRRDLDQTARAKLFIQSAIHYGKVLGFARPDAKPSAREAHAILREVYLFLRETRGAYSSSR